MNIEGAEYDLIIRWKTPPADQLIISFHHHNGKFNNKATQYMIDLLSEWYDYTCICEQYAWYLFFRK